MESINPISDLDGIERRDRTAEKFFLPGIQGYGKRKRYHQGDQRERRKFFSRKEIEDLTHFVQNFGAKGLMSAKVAVNGWQSSIQKFISEGERKAVDDVLEARENDLLLFVAGPPKVVNQSWPTYAFISAKS